MRRSWKSWTASVSGAGSRACYASGTMKPLLTSVCSARRRASRSSLLTKLLTPSSPFEVSGKQINTANSPVIDRFYGPNIMFFFPCRVWHLFVFGLPGRNDVVHLCRLTQQVFYLTYVALLGFNCILVFCLTFFFSFTQRSQVFFYSAGMSTGMIASLIILFFILARFLPKVSYFSILNIIDFSPKSLCYRT